MQSQEGYINGILLYNIFTPTRNAVDLSVRGSSTEHTNT